MRGEGPEAPRGGLERREAPQPAQEALGAAVPDHADGVERRDDGGQRIEPERRAAEDAIRRQPEIALRIDVHDVGGICGARDGRVDRRREGLCTSP